MNQSPTRVPSPRAFVRSGWLALVLAVLPIVPSQALAADGPVVSGVRAEERDGNTVVQVSLADGEATVSPFRQGDPERLVLDVSGAALAETFTSATGGLVSRVDAQPTEGGGTRIVLFLTGPASWEITRGTGNFSVALRPGAVADPLAAALGVDVPTRLSGPARRAEGPVLASLDFQQKDRVSRVILGVKGTEAAVAHPQPEVVTVDLPGAKMPQSLRRELNTRWFQSAVDSVRATPTRAGTRVTIRLRQGAEYEVKREGELTVLEVQIPAGVNTPVATALGSAQTALPAAPGTPATSGGAPGLSNAGGSEVLISGSGRRVDAQAVFGSGEGSQAPGGFAFAMDAGSVNSPRGDGSRMSITLQDADIHTVFRLIAEHADVNIVASDEVQGKISVRIKDTPWDEALGSILQAKGLGAQRYGNILRVAPIEKIKAEQQAALEAKKAGDELAPLTVYVAPLNYATASQVKDQVQALLSTRGALQVDERGNQLIIRDAEDNVAQARELLKALDRANREVDIEARFVEASSTFTRSLGDRKSVV